MRQSKRISKKITDGLHKDFGRSARTVLRKVEQFFAEILLAGRRIPLFVRAYSKEWVMVTVAAGLIAAPYSVDLATGNWQLAAVKAMPQGGEVRGGDVQIVAPVNNEMQIKQSSQRAAIDWQSFNIAQNEKVKFVQPNADASILNNIIGNDASRIYGALESNGKVFLSNQNGVYFSPTSRVDVGSLVASALNINAHEFMDGKYNFAGGNGSVVCEGEIRAAEMAVLVGKDVQNTGRIIAKRVAVGAGEELQLNLDSEQMIAVRVPATVTKVVPGLIDSADYVEITTQQAKAVLGGVVNMSGIDLNPELNVVGGDVVFGAVDAATVTGGQVSLNGSQVSLGAVSCNSVNVSSGSVSVGGGISMGQTGGIVVTDNSSSSEKSIPVVINPTPAVKASGVTANVVVADLNEARVISAAQNAVNTALKTNGDPKIPAAINPADQISKATVTGIPEIKIPDVNIINKG